MCGVFTRGAFATEPFEDVEKGNISWEFVTGIFYATADTSDAFMLLL